MFCFQSKFANPKQWCSEISLGFVYRMITYTASRLSTTIRQKPTARSVTTSTSRPVSVFSVGFDSSARVNAIMVVFYFTSKTRNTKSYVIDLIDGRFVRLGYTYAYNVFQRTSENDRLWRSHWPPQSGGKSVLRREDTLYV